MSKYDLRACQQTVINIISKGRRVFLCIKWRSYRVFDHNNYTYM